MMRRLLTLLVCIVTAGLAMADKVSQSEALKKAQAFMPGERFEVQKYSTSVGGQAVQDPFYIFNVANDGGYVLVSGDDRTTAILGYSKSGNIDLNKIPDNLRYWLDSYAAQLKALQEGKLVAVKKAATRAERATIAPLVKTTWNQGEPYNLMCPDGNGVDWNQEGYDTSKRSVSGCVATAVAQVMYFHKWPNVTTSIPAYSLTIDGHYTTLNALPSTTFEWTKMKTSYNYGDESEGAYEVAKLMRYVGQAFEMGYSPSASGTWIHNDAMVNYFGYSKQIHTIYRDNYTETQWESMVYDELAKGRPLPYRGATETTGHLFVCDGYENTYFHLNWGWGGWLDGHFVLSIADPNGEQGIGGSDGAFKYGQNTVLNFIPATANEEEIPIIVSYVNKNYIGVNYTRASASADFSDISITGETQAYYDYAPSTTYTVELGWGLYQGEQLIKHIGHSTKTIDCTGRNSNYAWLDNNLINISFGAGLPDGKYQLRQIFRKAGSNNWTLADNYGTDYLVAEINGTSLRIRCADAGNAVFRVNSMSVSDEPMVGVNTTVTVNITNTGETNNETVCLWMTPQGSEDWTNVTNATAYIGPGETGDVVLKFTPESAGNYTLKVTTNTSDEALASQDITVANTVEVEVDGITYRCIPTYKKAFVLYGGDNGNEELTIPATVVADGTECKVTAISDAAFYNWWNIRTLTIPEGIETIGDEAFRYCGSLTRLDLPSTLKGIGTRAFEESGLTDIVSHIAAPFAISDDVFVTWDQNAGQYVPSKATLYVPIGTKSLYQNTAGWNLFTSIVEGELKDAIINHVKYQYSSGTGTATATGTDLDKVGELVIPTFVTINGQKYTVREIRSYAFAEKSVTSLTLPEELQFIGDYAFQRNYKLTDFTMPSKLQSIGRGAFWNCNGLRTVNLPEGLKALGIEAFGACNGLQKLTLPSTLTSIGNYVINYCSSLSAVISHIQDPFYISDYTFVNTSWNSTTEQNDIYPSPATLYVPAGTKSKYQAISGWTKFAGIEEGEVKEAKVGDLNYQYSTGSKTATVIAGDYSSLTSIDIPATVNIDGTNYQVKAIGNGAFNHLWDINSVTIAEGIESIGTDGLAGLNITELTLPSTLKTIADYALEDNSNLKSLVIPEGVESIGNYALGWCSSLQKLELPSTLTSIGEYVINYCSALSAVVSRLEEPIQVSDQAFVITRWNESTRQNDITPSQATLYVPVGTKSKYQAIKGWTMFADIQEGELRETKVGDLYYQYATGGTNATVIRGDYSELTSVNIPSNVTIGDKSYQVKAIGPEAFGYYGNISSVTIASGIETIGRNAFAETGISNLTLPATLKSIGNDAFSWCYQLSKLVLPSSLTRIGYGIIAGDENLQEVISYIQNPFQVSNYTFMLRSDWNNETQQETIFPHTATLYVPKGTKSAYENAGGWNMFAAIIEQDVVAGSGDANGDGRLTATDAVTIIRYILGESPAGFDAEAADVNGDGQVTVTDAVQVINMILQQQ